MKKKFLKHIFQSIFVLCMFFWCISVGFWDDLLSKAFSKALHNDYVIDIGNSKKYVGQSLTRSQTSSKLESLKFWEKENWKKKNNPPLLVRIAKILLRFTVAISVTMIIYNAILYGIKVIWWDDYKSKESIKKLAYVWLGLVLALSSIILINIIRSIATTVMTAW